MSVFQGTQTLGYDEPAPLTDQWTDIFRRDTAVHLGIMASITVATFQGYLKDRIGGPVPYALADLCFVGALIVWFGSLALRHAPIRGPGSVVTILLGIVIIPTIYLLHPSTPFVIELAGLRGWAEFPVACLIALTTIRSRGQVRAYVGLILLLCAFTAVYGIIQYTQGPTTVLGVGSLAVTRHGSSLNYYIEGTGQTDFRAFSTFTFPAPFAGMMVFGILLAAGIALSKRRSGRLRVLAGLLIPVMFVGMTVSGTRAALITLLVGLMVIGWLRRFSFAQFLIVPVLFAAFHVATMLTAGRILNRLLTLFLEEGRLWTYIYAPLTIAGRALAESPFGYGLGRTGIGVPFGMVTSRPAGYFIFSDGDVGRAAVEMGVIGLLLLAAIIVGLIPAAARTARQLVGTDSDDLAFGIGALIISTGLLLIIGSPLSSAPHGMIWWFLLGALFKLIMLHDDETMERQNE